MNNGKVAITDLQHTGRLNWEVGSPPKRSSGGVLNEQPDLITTGRLENFKFVVHSNSPVLHPKDGKNFRGKSRERDDSRPIRGFTKSPTGQEGNRNHSQPISSEFWPRSVTSPILPSNSISIPPLDHESKPSKIKNHLFAESDTNLKGAVDQIRFSDTPHTAFSYISNLQNAAQIF